MMGVLELVRLVDVTGIEPVTPACKVNQKTLCRDHRPPIFGYVRDGTRNNQTKAAKVMMATPVRPATAQSEIRSQRFISST